LPEGEDRLQGQDHRSGDRLQKLLRASDETRQQHKHGVNDHVGNGRPARGAEQTQAQPVRVA